MFNQSNHTDSYEREKLRILQELNDQIQLMVVKLDHIVTHVEETHFKIMPNTQHNNLAISTNLNSQRIDTFNNSIKPTNNNNQLLLIATTNEALASATNKPNKINSLPNRKPKLPVNNNSNNLLSTNVTNEPSNNNSNHLDNKQVTQVTEVKKEGGKPDTTAKRNKQQRIFNTFVRESISQLLGPDFMKTHDVQDIDASVMEMIRKEAVENYLPDNIRPRRAWHLAKASLRTLKRTLNNRK